MMIGYARVSTSDQKLALQRDALEAAGCERIYEDYASGAKSDREGLLDALSYLSAGDSLVVWKLDRLGRSVLDLVKLVEEMRRRGIQLRSLQEGFDTGTHLGRFFIHILAALAEMEREMIRERINAGIAAAKARGVRLGHQHKLDAAKLDRVRALLSDGAMTVGAVAADVGVTRQTLHRYLAAERAQELARAAE